MTYLNHKRPFYEVTVLQRLTSSVIVLYVQKNVVQMNHTQIEQKNGEELKRWGHMKQFLNFVMNVWKNFPMISRLLLSKEEC